MAKAQLQVANDDNDIEQTRARVYAYLHALQPMDGCAVTDGYQRGRELIAILAETSEGDGWPKRKLSLDECADVIAYMHSSEPRNRGTFYKDVTGKPSVECGYHFVLFALEEAIRAAIKARNTKKAA